MLTKTVEHIQIHRVVSMGRTQLLPANPGNNSHFALHNLYNRHSSAQTNNIAEVGHKALVNKWKNSKSIPRIVVKLMQIPSMCFCCC